MRSGCIALYVHIEDILDNVIDIINDDGEDGTYTFWKGNTAYKLKLEVVEEARSKCGNAMKMLTDGKITGWGCLHCHPEYADRFREVSE